MDKDTNKDSNTSKSPDDKLVDLSALEGFNFATNWSESKSGRSNVRDFGTSDRKPRGNQADRKDRRPFKPGSFRKSTGSAPDEKRREAPGSPSDRRRQFSRPEIPKTVVEVSFFPEDNGFNAICKALRVSTITYELFDIARTILEKEERFYMVLRPVDAKPTGGDQPESSLFIVEADGLPFLNESAARDHALENCLDYFFTKETQEVEAPTGSFSSIQKCGITGELLAPPNYHRYKKIMMGHHASRVSNMPFEKFESRIETIKDEEVIAEWLEKMKIQTTYALKPEFGEARQFEDAETARSFAKANLASKQVNEVKSAHIDGSLLSRIKDPLIKANIEYVWERQKRFPLETANLLRGRLRRQKFAIYKKGTKGVSFVCAVKRRFREPAEDLSIPVQKLIVFIEENPKISAKELAVKFLGFPLSAAEGEVPPALTDDQKLKLKAYSLDFHWLLKEGYIAEYSDGKVYAHPAVEPPANTLKNKGSKSQKVSAKQRTEKSADVADSEENSEVASTDEQADEISKATDVQETINEDSSAVDTKPTDIPEVEIEASDTAIEEPVQQVSEESVATDEEVVVESPEEDAKIEELKDSTEEVAETKQDVEDSSAEDQVPSDGEIEGKAEEKDPAKS